MSGAIVDDRKFKGRPSYLCRLEMMSVAAGEKFFANRATEAIGVDWRFYFPEGDDMVAKPVSEVARVAAVSATVSASKSLDLQRRIEALQHLKSAMWANASVKDFVLEAIVNGCLAFCDWKDLNPFGFPDWPAKAREVQFFKEGKVRVTPEIGPTLFIPTAWRFPNVDSLIVYEFEGIFYVVGIQITLQTPEEHKKSLQFLEERKFLSYLPK